MRIIDEILERIRYAWIAAVHYRKLHVLILDLMSDATKDAKTCCRDPHKHEAYEFILGEIEITKKALFPAHIRICSSCGHVVHDIDLSDIDESICAWCYDSWNLADANHELRRRIRDLERIVAEKDATVREYAETIQRQHHQIEGAKNVKPINPKATSTTQL